MVSEYHNYINSKIQTDRETVSYLSARQARFTVAAGLSVGSLGSNTSWASTLTSGSLAT